MLYDVLRTARSDKELVGVVKCFWGGVSCVLGAWIEVEGGKDE